MKEYKAVIYQENLLSSLIFGSAKINPVKFSDANQPGVSRVLSLSRTAKAMADAVNIPQLAYTVMWRRSSDTAAP